ncbi:hypothetical protein IHE61_27095 [Streptomyces sp. GKU 257-1]|nr:hypothetical protein [Streptomyces sp. GKU 257-1]
MTPLELTGTEAQFEAIENKVRSFGLLPPGGAHLAELDGRGEPQEDPPGVGRQPA